MLSGFQTADIASSLKELKKEKNRHSASPKPFRFKVNNPYYLAKLQDLGLRFPGPNEEQNLNLEQALAQLQAINHIEQEHTIQASDKLLLKKYKLAIIKSFEQHLQVLSQVPVKRKKKTKVRWPFLRRFGFSFLLAIGLIMDGSGSFLGSQELIQLIPGVSSPIALTVGVAFSLINSALFYSFEASMLKQAMGIHSYDEISTTLHLDEKEIDHANKINQLMTQISDKIDRETFISYAKFTNALNTDIKNNKKHFHPKCDLKLLSSTPNDKKVKTNDLYLYLENNTIMYATKTSKGIIREKITPEEYQEHDYLLNILKKLGPDKDKEKVNDAAKMALLEIISKKGHILHKDTLTEGKANKLFRHLVTGVGAIMVAGYSYFMANSLLIFAVPGIVGTPIGWALITLGIVTMLAYYLSMRGKAMVNMLNPAVMKFKQAKAKFDQLTYKDEKELTAHYDEQQEKRTFLQLRQTLKHLKNENESLQKNLNKQAPDNSRASPARVQLAVIEEEPPPELTFPEIQLTPDERKKLQLINEKHGSPLHFPKSQGHELISALEQELKSLSALEEKLTDNHDKHHIKKYKLAIITAFAQHLQTLSPSASKPPEPKPPLSWPFLRRIGYGVLLTIGLIMDGIGSFLGGQELISLIPGVSGSLALTVGIVFSLINSALFYSFEAGLLKQALGLNSLDKLGSLLALDEDAIHHTNQINQLMLSKDLAQLDEKTHAVYASFTDSLNQNIQNNKKHYAPKELTEKKSNKMLRHFVTAVGALMVAGYSYFMANSLLVFAVPPLVGTPVGWALIALGIATMLAYYLSMRGKAMVNMLNPAIQKFQEVKVKAEKFEIKHKNDFQLAYEEHRENRSKEDITAEITSLREQNKALRQTLIEKPALAVITDSHDFWKTPIRPTEKAELTDNTSPTNSAINYQLN